MFLPFLLQNVSNWMRLGLLHNLHKTDTVDICASMSCTFRPTACDCSFLYLVDCFRPVSSCRPAFMLHSSHRRRARGRFVGSLRSFSNMLKSFVSFAHPHLLHRRQPFGALSIHSLHLPCLPCQLACFHSLGVNFCLHKMVLHALHVFFGVVFSFFLLVWQWRAHIHFCWCVFLFFLLLFVCL